MARAALGWGVRDLARKADVNANTVTRIESGGETTVSVLNRVQEALESAGVVFLEPGQIRGDGYGVRMLPKFDGWLVNLDERWVRNDRLMVSLYDAEDGSMTACGATPLIEPMSTEEYEEQVTEAMAAVSHALRQRNGKLARMPAEVERQLKLKRLREALIEGENSGRAEDSSIESILGELDRGDRRG
ncbi:MAG: type II toxin-antitoxin system ParD family antitoxin [Alphaproteobacteria bacterium]|nr:type II toxin-antitoxin system ParD family antitoxin [Alphaproteobacteria bacterium]